MTIRLWIIAVLISFTSKVYSASIKDAWLAVLDHEHEYLRDIFVDESVRKQISTHDSEHWTLLHFAVRDQCTQCVKILLAAGANPLLTDYNGQLPLHYALDIEDHTKKGHIIYRLLEASANHCAVHNGCVNLKANRAKNHEIATDLMFTNSSSPSRPSSRP